MEVTHDLNMLKSKLYQFLPDENIEVDSAQEKVVLRGLVSSQQNMDTAVKIQCLSYPIEVITLPKVMMTI